MISFIGEYTDFDCTDYLRDVLSLDMLTLNIDRHFHNLALIRQGETYKECPIFDNGAAFLSNYTIFPPGYSLEELGRSIAEIKAIFLTHAHPDHIGGAAEIKKASGCEVYASIIERKWTEDINIQFQDRPIPNFYTLVKESVNIDKIVKEGQRITLEAGMTLCVLETPGHSFGSISYVLEENGIIFSGDAIPAHNDFPIFVDEKASEKSLLKIKDQTKIQFCCPAWDKVYGAVELGGVLQNRIKLLKELKLCVQKVEAEYTEESEEMKQKRISESMGWEGLEGNPLFRQSLNACR